MNSKPRDNKLNLEKFVTDGNVIIKINESDKTHHHGFDIIKECYTTLEIDKCYKLPQIVFDLIANEKSRVKLIYHAADKCTIAYKAKCLDITDRTFYRLIAEIGLNSQ